MDNHEDSVIPNGPPNNLPVEPQESLEQSPPIYQPETIKPTEITEPPIPEIPPTPPVPPSIEQEMGSFPAQAPEPQPYTPPVPDFSMPPPEKKKPSILTFLLVTMVVIIIAVLAFFIYYFVTKSIQTTSTVEQESTENVAENTEITTTPETTQETTQTEELPSIVPTKVIAFSVPTELPTTQKQGECLTGSLAQPYRTDAFRCYVGTEIYDPCFKTSQSNLVFCQMNPISTTSFVIKTTKELPKITITKAVQSNWAWFVKLSDGTICSPFTGVRPVLSDKKIAYYGCTSTDKTKQIMLIGDLLKGQVWTAQEVISEKQATSWVRKSINQVNIDTVWQ